MIAFPQSRGLVTSQLLVLSGTELCSLSSLMGLDLLCAQSSWH